MPPTPASILIGTLGQSKVSARAGTRAAADVTDWSTHSESELQHAWLKLAGGLRTEGVFTHIAGWGSSWDPTSARLEANRDAARRGVRIEHIWLVPDSRAARSPELTNTLARDRSAGIDTRVADVGALMTEGPDAAPAALEVALWDGQLASMRERTPSGGPAWRITAEPNDVEDGRRWIDRLRALAVDDLDGAVESAMPSPASDPRALSEPLAASAAVARVAAPQLCLPASDGRPGCAAYHGVYPLLRVLGLAASPERHAEFYDRELGALAGDGRHRRVLVSGTADQGMTAQVLRAYRARGAEPELHALDICPTPGLLCQTYGRWTGARIETHTGDVLRWRPSAPFDVITTHSFIAKFAPRDHVRLFESWRACLREGGRLVTTARIDPTADEADAGFGAEQAEAFSRSLRSAVAPWSDLLGLDASTLHDLALEHCAGIRSHAVQSESQLAADLRAAGFEILSLEMVEHRGRMSRGGSGAGTHRTASYADFVAVAR